MWREGRAVRGAVGALLGGGATDDFLLTLVVGTAVGNAVGTAVGVGGGAGVGAGVGTAVGTAVGAAVGTAVGAAVGSATPRSATSTAIFANLGHTVRSSSVPAAPLSPHGCSR